MILIPAIIPAQQLGLGQRYQVLVPVQFPYDFMVAHHREIEKRNLEPGIERRTFAVHGIEMPVDLFRIDVFAIATGTIAGKSEVKIFVAQQPKTMAANLLGLAQNGVRFAGQMFAQ